MKVNGDAPPEGCAEGKMRTIRAESREERGQGSQGEYFRRRSAADSPGDWRGWRDKSCTWIRSRVAAVAARGLPENGVRGAQGLENGFCGLQE